MTYRILLTGSKDWEIDEVLFEALDEHLDKDDVTLIHGGTPTGAEATAAKYAANLGWSIEAYPPNWVLFAEQAGFMRSLEMIVRGADICLAFIKDQSREASYCAQNARTARIKTIVYSQDGEYNDGKFAYCQAYLAFGEFFLHCDKEAGDNHENHEGSGSDDEGQLYIMSWKG